MSPKPAKFAHRNLPLLLLQAREHVIACFRPILNEHGLTEQQWRILRLLVDAGALEPREIGEQCRISSPSLAGVLSRMQQLGLIKRRRFDRDRRRVRVSLTAKSRALARRMAPAIEATYRRLESQVGRDFSARLYRTIDTLIESLRDPGIRTARMTVSRTSASAGFAAAHSTPFHPARRSRPPLPP
jgi:homoprotocatechuate degradation regulator HpaR